MDVKGEVNTQLDTMSHSIFFLREQISEHPGDCQLMYSSLINTPKEIQNNLVPGFFSCYPVAVLESGKGVLTNHAII